MFKKFQEKLRDKNRTKRAFLCVDLGDIKGLLACLDDGFDINTARPNHKVYHGKSFLLETVSSLAYKNKNWPMLKALIEYAGSANNIIFGDYIGSEDGGPSFRTGIHGPPDPALWDNLANKTYEHSPLHFCL